MDEINKYGLLNSLLSIINTYDEDDSKVVMAKYFLKNFNHIEDINIFDAADECFVTRASIRRFSQYIGFDNFKDLKANKIGYNYYRDSEIPEDYPDYLANQIIQMMNDCNRHIKAGLIQMLEYIQKSDEIVFFVSDIYASKCMEFQKELVFAGKVVRIVSFNFYNSKLLQNLSKNSLLIVISVTGGSAKSTLEFIKEFSCQKILMTSITDNEVLQYFDFIFTIGGENLPSQKTIYHTFAVEYSLEIVATEYKRMVYAN